MLDTIIITVLGIIVVIQNIYIMKSNYKIDMFDELHKYHNELVSITEKYINNSNNAICEICKDNLLVRKMYLLN